MTEPLVLILRQDGVPQGWVTVQRAIEYHATDSVDWAIGDVLATYHGGYNASGQRTVISTQSILALRRVDGHYNFPWKSVPALTNRNLFIRDRYLCAYCGDRFKANQLSRDHVQARSKGGADVWTNCVTSCKPCNHRKGNLSLNEAGMKLLYVPYEPVFTIFEKLMLENRHIRADQMDWLEKFVSIKKFSD